MLRGIDTFLSLQSLHRITHLFSQPLYLKDKEFNYFWLNNNDRFGISVYSFFYIYKFIKDPSDNAQANLQFFRLDNPKLREVLHTPERDEQVEK